MASNDSTPIDTETEVWLGSATSIPGEQFIEALHTVREFQTALQTVQAELADMETGLDRDDSIRLIYGRNAGMSIGQVKAGFDILDTVINEDLSDIAPRLMADRTGNLTIAEAAEVWGDMVRLAEKYGSLNDDMETDR